ncbi:type II toxin-antitoxin system RelE/ParE family toxin [Microbacterium halotolerans]|uniref:type II toxin-antitoxin system RelE/ParE family toxin n=1 Tax=Microbacterium halotolerans TaxID=246613 RepID=UPI000E6ADC01|nr:type II toxin-antitoxin system RelE/ParE family toxin [Microbacterium halotolerans]
MIRSFANALTEQVWRRERVRKLSIELERQAHRKLLILNRAANLNDLRVPPGNRLEKLSGNRAGQHSIRINNQFRICFRWTADGPEEVEIVDYH